MKPIYRYVFSRVGNTAEAEEITSQVFLDALACLSGYREHGHLAGWLFTIARRRVADHFRHHNPTQPWLETPDDQSLHTDPLTRMVRDERLRGLTRQIALLDDGQQELLRLRFAADLTYSEIGMLLERSEAAVKMAIYRLLRRLARELEETE